MVPSPVLLLLLASSLLLKMLAAEPYFYLHQRPRWLHLREQLTRRGLQPPRPVQPRYGRSTRAGPPAMGAPAMEASAMDAPLAETPEFEAPEFDASAFEAPAFEGAAFKAPSLRSGPPMAFEPMSAGGRGGFMGDTGSSRSLWMPSDIAEYRPKIGRQVESVFFCSEERSTCHPGGERPVVLYQRGARSVCSCLCPIEFGKLNCQPY